MDQDRWSELPADVLPSVMARLNLADQVRMSAVCTGWSLVATDSSRRPPPLPTLWMLLPQQQGRDAPEPPPGFEFVSFSEDMRRYAPGLRFGDCIASSEGWLMVVDELGGLHAVDPISGDRILLLSGDATAPVPRYRKSIFLPPRGSGGGRSAVAAAVIRPSDEEYRGELTFARGGVTLQVVGFPAFQDIAVHDGKLYALCIDSRVVVFYLDNDDPSSSSPHRSVSVIHTERDLRPFVKKHLGVMAGSLVMLQWTYCKPCPFRLRGCIPEFEVFRLQMEPEPKWVELRDLGGHAVLLGADGFTALPTWEFPELRSNCIYSLVRTSDEDGGGAVLEVVDLQSKGVAVEPLCGTSAAPIWFRPSRSSFTTLWTNREPANRPALVAGKL